MSKQLWIISIVIVVIGTGWLVLSKKENIKPKNISIKSSSITKAVKDEIPEIEKKDKPKSILPSNDARKNKIAEKKNEIPFVEKEEVVQKDIENIEEKKSYYVEGEERVKEIIEDLDLKDVTPSKGKNVKFRVFAKISKEDIQKEENSILPPMVLVFIKAAVPGGKSIGVVVDGDVARNNKEIFIAKTNENGQPQDLLKVSLNQESSVQPQMQESQEQENYNEQENVQQKKESPPKIEVLLPPAPGQ